MSDRLELAFTEHPKFWEYCLFFENSTNPACQDCNYLVNFTTTSARNVLGRVAILNRRKTRVKAINVRLEESVLVEEQQKFLELVGHCPGETVIEQDVELKAQTIRSFGERLDISQRFIDSYIQNLLPVTGECPLLQANNDT